MFRCLCLLASRWMNRDESVVFYLCFFKSASGSSATVALSSHVFVPLVPSVMNSIGPCLFSLWVIWMIRPATPKTSPDFPGILSTLPTFPTFPFPGKTTEAECHRFHPTRRPAAQRCVSSAARGGCHGTFSAAAGGDTREIPMNPPVCRKNETWEEKLASLAILDWFPGSLQKAVACDKYDNYGNLWQWVVFEQFCSNVSNWNFGAWRRWWTRRARWWGANMKRLNIHTHPVFDQVARRSYICCHLRVNLNKSEHH